jgi:class 3 adenylate cyclase
MAVSGLPVSNERHAHACVEAGLEMRDFITKRRAEGGPFQVRIGIHSGPVVAGIVGVKKFAYDIWGDTVNTASRMEQHSQAGQVNISQATYERVKDAFGCSARGKIAAKNKGAIEMYFVEGAEVAAEA